MQPSVLGPYRIESEIGSGGMGTVYRATVEGKAAGLETGQQVALKVVHPHLLAQAGFFKRFLREGEVGRRVRHENVVSTLDIDATEVDGRTVLFLAMEYVEGRTLRALLNDLGTVPEVLLREIARQVTAGLEAIHDAGIVHRDLKPENVLVTEEQQVRIMDLGVARLVEESLVLTPAGHFAGSVLYAAPEQFRQEDVGPAADLYALGVLLYELASNQNPFRHDDLASVTHAHLDITPPPLAHRTTGISLFLSEVVSTLLAKSPEARFPSAAVLRQVLDEGERSAWWAVREREILERGRRRPEVPVRRPTAVYGRDGDLELLQGAWHSAKEGEGNTLLLEGEAGIGKTRLVDAFLDRTNEEDARLLYGAYLPTGGLGGLSDGILGHFGTLGLEEALRPYLSAAPGLVPAFAAVVRHERPPTGAQPVEGDVLHAVMVQLVRKLAEEKPLLWVVEDLHFAPPESRRVALSVARALAGHRALLLMTTRPGLPEDELAHFTRLDNCRRGSIGRLSPREVMELLREALGSEALADRLGGPIAYKSDGVPFFVFEILRGLEEGRYLRQQDDGTYVESREIDKIEIPSAVRDLVRARLKDLSREERAILDVGAVQGFAFDASLVARVLDRKRIPVLQALAEVERRFGLVRAAGRLLRFDHHQVQEVLYESLPEALRVEYHAALADARAEHDGIAGLEGREIPPDTALFLASNHLRGSRAEAALPFLDAALDHLGRTYRGEAVIELVDRALALPGLAPEAERLDLLVRRAQCLSILGRRDAQRESLEAAMHLAEALGEPGPTARVLTELGWYQVRGSSYAEAERILRRAVELAKDASHAELERAATQNLGVSLIYLARFEEARACCDRALALSVELGDRRGEALALGSLGNLLRNQGRYEEAAAHHERHAALAREVGDARVEITALGNLGNVRTYQRRYEEAAELYREALELSERVGDRYQRAMLLGNLGGSCQSRGRLGEALEHYERAVALAQELGNRQGEANVLLNLGSARRELGDPRGGEQALRSALAISTEIGDQRLEAHTRQTLGDLVKDRGELDEAHRHYEGARRIFERLGSTRRAGQSHARIGMIWAKRGDVDVAREHLEKALDLVRSQPAPGADLSILCHLASFPGGDVAAARRAYEQWIDSAGLFLGMEASYQLWKATKDRAYLERAHEFLTRIRDEVPECYRTSIVENVPLHRDVQAAWTGSDPTHASDGQPRAVSAANAARSAGLPGMANSRTLSIRGARSASFRSAAMPHASSR